MKLSLIFLLLCVFAFSMAKAQNYNQDDSINTKSLTTRQGKRFNKILVRKYERVTRSLRKANDKYLHEFSEFEDKTLHSICNINEDQAESLLKNSLYSFRRFEEKLNLGSNEPPRGCYSGLDSLTSASSFIFSDSSEFSIVSKDSIHCFESNLELEKAQRELLYEIRRSEITSEYIKDRTLYLGKISSADNLSKSEHFNLTKINHYYQETINNRIGDLNVKSNLEKRIFNVLNSNTLFKDFVFSKSHFSVPNSSPLKIQVASEKLCLNDLLSNSGNPKLNIENIDAISGKIEDLKGKVDSLQLHQQVIPSDTLANSKDPKREEDSNSWKPNSFKSKTFFERLGYGFDTQVTRKTVFMPTAGTFLAEINYSLSDNLNFGLNCGFITSVESIALNSELNDISIKNEGCSFGLFSDYKLRNSLFFTGAFEYNNRPVGNTLEDNGVFTSYFLNSYWSSSALLGLKIKSSSSKRRQKNIEVVYDLFSSRTGMPPVSVRMGMNFLPK